MNIINLRPFHRGDSDAVIALWETCGLTHPWNNPHLDIERKASQNDDGFIVAEKDGDIIACVMFGYDGHRGSVNYLAAHPDFQGKHLGRTLMDYVEAKLTAQGCPKINLMVRSDNEQVLAFYQSLGYGVEQTVSLGKRLIADD